MENKDNTDNTTGICGDCAGSDAVDEYFTTVRGETHAEKVKRFNKIAKLFGGSEAVTVGEICDAYINYRTLSIHFKVKIPMQGEFEEYRFADGYIKADDRHELIRLWDDVYSDRLVAIDSATGELVGSAWNKDWK